MTTFQEKVTKLQAEVEILDEKLQSCSEYVNYLFYSSVATPFVIAFGLYLINPSFVNSKNETDRKKIIKWSAVITIIIWLMLYLANFYFKKKIY